MHNLNKFFSTNGFNLQDFEDSYETRESLPIIPVSSSNIIHENVYKNTEIAGYYMSKFKFKLYPYQEEGVTFLKKTKKNVLADDMGLGKTLQAIKAMDELLKELNICRCLVVAPRSLVYNWYNEINKYNPATPVSIVNTSSSNSSSIWSSIKNRSLVTIISYEELKRSSQFLENMYDLVIFDEAHKLRNNYSLVTKAAKRINSEYCWMLTGTPFEKSVTDYNTIFSILHPNIFDSKSKNIHTSKILSSKYILRRTKDQVLNELPGIIERDVKIELTKSQLEEYSIEERKANSLSQLQKLLRICDISSKGDSSKINESIEIIKKISSNNEKVVIFSYTLGVLDALAKELASERISYSYIKGELTLQERNYEIEKFKKNNTVLLASLMVGSEGLNLTEANNVIFLNKWWNPSNNEQARDRVNRIGQTKLSIIYSLSNYGTVEDKIEDIIKIKKISRKSLYEGKA